MAGECPPNQRLTGKVVGLYLEEKLIPQWLYAVELDSPQGLVEEYFAEDLVLESDIPQVLFRCGRNRRAVRSGLRRMRNCALSQLKGPTSTGASTILKRGCRIALTMNRLGHS